MRLNENTAVVGSKVVLVPYRKEHVEKYHQWMKDPALLEATASEPLTLEEEYDMQRKWHLDDDKLTFIVLARPEGGEPADKVDLKQCTMIGDVNLFLPDGPQGEDVECEIMIAEPSHRGRGIAKECLGLMLHYASAPSPAGLAIDPRSFIARIGTTNVGSLKLFESLGFGKVKVVEVFQEVEMRFGWRSEGREWNEKDLHEEMKTRWGEPGRRRLYDGEFRE